MTLQPLRRIVTGHNVKGVAVIESDILLKPFNPLEALNDPDAPTDEDANDKPAVGFIHVWRTEEVPAVVQEPWADYHGKPISLSSEIGTTVRVVDMPPGTSSPLHRTISLDLGVVLIGEIVLELDDGLETLVRSGETVVQRGTIHAWHNRSQNTARLLFVLIPSQPVVVDGVKLDKTDFAIN